MNGYIKESNRGGVYSRLYLDSTVRKKKQDIIEKNVGSIAEIISKPRTRIENTLLQKHAKSQAKINTLRLRQQIKESESVKSVPKINKISKQIMDLKEGTLSSDSISLYTAKLVNSTRFAPSSSNKPKQSFLSLMDLDKNAINDPKNANFKFYEENSEDSVIKKPLEFILLKNLQKNENLIFKNENSLQKNDSFIQKSEISYQKSENLMQKGGSYIQKAENVNEKDRDKEKEIEELRNAVLSRCKVLEHEEPQVDLLKMNVIERSNYWLKNREQRIKQQEENKKNKETDGCTFSPRLESRLDTSRDSRRNYSVNRSYSSRNMLKFNRTESTSKKNSQLTSPVLKNKAMLYKSLSPHERTVSQGNLSNLLHNPRPMVSYKV